MKNYVSAIPATLPGNVIAPVRVDTNDATIFSLAIYVGPRRKPLPLGKLTLYHNGDVDVICTRFLDSHVQRSAWRGIVREYGGLDDFDCDRITVRHYDD